MAEAMIGILSEISRVTRVRISTSRRQHLRQSRPQQDVVEGQGLPQTSVGIHSHRQLRLTRPTGLIGAVDSRDNDPAGAKSRCPWRKSTTRFGLAEVSSTSAR